MAEYKTFTCDRCGKQEAIHLKIPAVDIDTDPVDGHASTVHGYVDLCREHLETIFPHIIKDYVNTKELRRQVWKRMLNEI